MPDFLPAKPDAVSVPDCADCGACCREAYHAVELDGDEPFVRLHTELIDVVDGRLNLRRAGDRCACLTGELGSFACTLYAERPQTCRDFERGSDNCREARARVGLPT